MLILLIFSIFSAHVQCHCPHMMGINPPGPPAGPSAPGKLPDGDEGWDYDETAAPGILPESHFIQSTYVYRSPNAQEKKFSGRVINVLKETRERLSKRARLTLENENVECNSPTDHYRCQEFPTTGAWNYLIVEDPKTGAVIYTFERKYNEKNDGTIEMALLDAISRHAPSSLIAFASKEAEKEVGYIRALSSQEMQALGKPAKKSISVEKYGPMELNLLEPALLEVRTGANLVLKSDKLVKFASVEEFDKALEKHRFVFVLFWNSNRMVSLHTFNLWSRFAEKFQQSDDTVLAHVPCHENADFCHGLNSMDFQTIVAYRDGQNIGKTENIGDEEFYRNWVEIMQAPPLHRISSEAELAEFKKGIFNNKKRDSITIGIFESEQDTSFQHFQIAAEKLVGKYYLGYFISGKPDPVISTYRSMEKQKRSDYTGRFDPASLMEFITKSSLPSIFSISSGFSTDLLLRQKRPLLLLIGSDSAPFQKLAARSEARQNYIFAKIEEGEDTKKCIESLGVTDTPAIVMLNKDRVHIIAGDKPKCPDHLLRILQMTATGEPDKVLSTKEPHPLRYLQVTRVNQLFGYENSIVLPDHTLFMDRDPFATSPHPTPSTGGCPFMAGGGGATTNDVPPTHNEL